MGDFAAEHVCVMVRAVHQAGGDAYVLERHERDPLMAKKLTARRHPKAYVACAKPNVTSAIVRNTVSAGSGGSHSGAMAVRKATYPTTVNAAIAIASGIRFGSDVMCGRE